MGPVCVVRGSMEKPVGCRSVVWGALLQHSSSSGSCKKTFVTCGLTRNISYEHSVLANWGFL